MALCSFSCALYDPILMVRHGSETNWSGLTLPTSIWVGARPEEALPEMDEFDVDPAENKFEGVKFEPQSKTRSNN